MTDYNGPAVTSSARFTSVFITFSMEKVGRQNGAEKTEGRLIILSKIRWLIRNEWRQSLCEGDQCSEAMARAGFLHSLSLVSPGRWWRGGDTGNGHSLSGSLDAFPDFWHRENSHVHTGPQPQSP